MQSRQIAVIGWSHKNAPVEFRDKISLSADQIRLCMASAMSREGIREFCVLSTCNRTEFYAVVRDMDRFKPQLMEVLKADFGISLDSTTPEPYFLVNGSAIDHLFSVAAGLESMMLGENQILTQVKGCYEIMLSSGLKLPVLFHMFQDAIRTGKTVRTRTKLCRGAVSISFAAVELARRIYSEFKNHTILIVGAGETGTLVARHFRDAGANQFIIANRSLEKRQMLADEFNCSNVELSELTSALISADIVVTATGSKTHLIGKSEMRSIMKARKHNSMLMIDISTPRNIDPEINMLSDIFLFDIDHLKGVISGNLDLRKKSIPDARKIIEEIEEEFLEWLRTLRVTPTISKLGSYFENVREAEVQKYIHKTTEAEYQRMEQLTKGLVRKLLHYPIKQMREMAITQQMDAAVIDAIWKLYKLDTIEKGDS